MARPITITQKPHALGLEGIKVFSHFPEAERQRLATRFHEACYAKESVVFFERDIPEDSGDRIYFVLQGCIKLVKYSSEGESTILRLVAQGDFFGATGTLIGKPYPFSAEALSDCRITSIGHGAFLELTREYPDVALKMLSELGKALWFNYETHNQVVKKTDTRVSKILLHHLEQNGYSQTPDGLQLNIRLPHEYIASMTGIAYEESVRIVSRLKKNHACIHYLRGGRILITDLDKLRELARGDTLQPLQRGIAHPNPTVSRC